MLIGETEDHIVDYLRPQGVTACKRIRIKKDVKSFETNTLLLTCNRVNVPKSLKIFYRVVLVDVYIPNPLRCFRGWSGGAMVLGKLPVPGRLTIWMIVGQGPIALAVGAGGGCLDILLSCVLFSHLSTRYRLKYCLKGRLSPKQPTNQLRCFNCQRFGHHENSCTEDPGSVC